MKDLLDVGTEVYLKVNGKDGRRAYVLGDLSNNTDAGYAYMMLSVENGNLAVNYIKKEFEAGLVTDQIFVYSDPSIHDRILNKNPRLLDYMEPGVTEEEAREMVETERVFYIHCKEILDSFYA